ncbi:MAG: SMP-30/gluconolactonase/LRE family protein [Planctomycetota bacterium]
MILPLMMLAAMAQSSQPAPSFADLVPADAKIEKVATGFGFLEGPAWLDGRLVFSDIPKDTIHALEADGPQVFRTPSHNANGNTVHDGVLYTCEHSSRVVSTTTDGERTVLVHEWDGKKFNSPNDIVVHSSGIVYFTDPYWGLPADKRDELMEYGGCYVFRVDGTEVVPVAKDFGRPNGLAFSPDESILYIGDDEKKHVRKFTVENDGSLSGGEVFCEIDPGVPDGMRVDTAGNLWCTAGDGVQVFAPDGTHLGTVECPESPANCELADGYLWMTARSSLYRIKVNAQPAM